MATLTSATSAAASSREKVDSELCKVPQIGAILVREGIITKAESDLVMAEIARKTAVAQTDPKSPKPGFFGEEAMKLQKTDGTPLLTKEQLNKALGQQAIDKALAATNDLQNIQAGKELNLPGWKKVHWGNGQASNPVNAAITNPEKIDSASAAANVAELIVLLANQKPEISSSVQEGVIAAKMLTMALIDGDKAIHPINKAGEWINAAILSLQTAARVNGVNDEIISSYTNNRFSEISAEIDRVLRAGRPIGSELSV